MTHQLSDEMYSGSKEMGYAETRLETQESSRGNEAVWPRAWDNQSRAERTTVDGWRTAPGP